MTAPGPTGAPAQPARVLLPADKNLSADGLLLEVALQTEDVIAFDEHSGVDGSMRLMAGRAALAHRLVFEHERTPLRYVTFAACLLLGGKGRAAPNDRLAFVRMMAISATDSSARGLGPGLGTGQHRMRIRQA